MFLLAVLLWGMTNGLQAEPNNIKAFLQTTVPEKISSPAAETDPEQHVAYHITIAGKLYFVYLQKQSFLSPESVIYSYDKNGTQHSETLSPQVNCSYSGYVAGFPNSLVTLNICSGLRGTIQFINVSYGIEPVEAVSGFVHMVYTSNNDNPNIPALKEDDSDTWFNHSQYQLRKSVNRIQYTKLFPLFLEMDIVVDKNLFDYMGSDTKVVTQKVLQIIGLVNTMLVQLKLTVLISSIDIWSDENKISTTGHPDHVLLKFLEWKRSNSNHGPHHISYLFAFEKHPVSIGATIPGKMCADNSDAGVALFPEGLSLESYTVIVVQLLGLSLGLTYDNPDSCHCSGEVCVMTPKALQSGGIKEFSTCSLDNFKYIVSQNGLECLRNHPVEVRTDWKNRVCGNGWIEGREECDCGTLKNCTHRQCCDPVQCRLKGQVDCGSGECCTQDCKIKPLNTICRPAFDECDFMDHCNGNDSYCVPDTYVRNGESCDSGLGYCYLGRCRVSDKQCQSLYGGESKGAPFHCFEELNVRGDRFGNCIHGYCLFENMLCGKLVCTWPHKRLVSRANLSVVYAHVRGDTCVSAFKLNHHWGQRDETYVDDGTMCGPDMYCRYAKCEAVLPILNYEKCNVTRDCDDHGMCNNYYHCHCEKDYIPPNCEPKKGAYGSIDDGHQFIEGKGFWRNRHATLPGHRLLLVFFITAPVAIIIIIAVIQQNKIRELCYRGGTENERSTSEESSFSSRLSSSRSNSP